jgi:hypothetical protein
MSSRSAASGDNLRAVVRCAIRLGAMAMHPNRNKRSVVLDSLQPEGREACFVRQRRAMRRSTTPRPQASATGLRGGRRQSEDASSALR